MSKLALILILLCALPSWAAISEITAAECKATAATSCTLGAHAFGDLEVTAGYKLASTTKPTLPSGYTSISSTTTGTSTSALSITWGWRFLNGGETATGAFTNATGVVAYVLRGADIQSAGPIGGSAFYGATSTTTTRYCGTAGGTGCSGSLVFTRADGTSWLLGAGICNSCTAGNVAPTGMTIQSGISSTQVAASDTAAGVSAFSSQTVTVTTSGTIKSAVIEILAASSNYGSPLSYIVHAIDPGAANDITSCTTVGNCTTFNLPLLGDKNNAGSLASNSLALFFTLSYVGVSDPTISNIYCNADTGHATWAAWTQRGSLQVAGNSNHGYAYTLDVGAAGCTTVHVALGSHAIDFEWAAWELTKVNGVDSSSIIEPTAPFMTSGTITPTQTGDVVLWHCSASTMETNYVGGNTYVPGGRTVWSDLNSGRAGGAFVWNSTTAFTFTPMMKALSGNGICSFIAFKASGGTGTAPTAPYILVHRDINVPAGATDTFEIFNLNAGDAVLLTANGPLNASQKQWCTVGSPPCITDTIGDSFTAQLPSDLAGGYPNFGYDTNITAGSGNITITAVNTLATPVWWMDEIVGLDNSSHTAAYDSAATGTNTNGAGAGQSETGTVFAVSNGTATPSGTPNIAPSTASGIVFASTEMGTGQFPMSNTGPSGAVQLCATYNGQTDGSNMCLGNMFAYVNATSTSNLSFNWSNSISTTFNASAIHFKVVAVAVGKPCTIALLGAGPC